ncbi:extensin [Triticum aestivum]|uniref:extensin n=1 Tax=Triticum aestivum TaxID=4565 RepID=UPI001D01F420|nr:extensin-like [Triticum aestivum]XP_045089686.1 extensin-like [Aegilops tauschii subsp. strangulata]
MPPNGDGLPDVAPDPPAMEAPCARSFTSSRPPPHAVLVSTQPQARPRLKTAASAPPTSRRPLPAGGPWRRRPPRTPPRPPPYAPSTPRPLLMPL